MCIFYKKKIKISLTKKKELILFPPQPEGWGYMNIKPREHCFSWFFYVY